VKEVLIGETTDLPGIKKITIPAAFVAGQTNDVTCVDTRENGVAWRVEISYLWLMLLG